MPGRNRKGITGWNREGYVSLVWVPLVLGALLFLGVYIVVAHELQENGDASVRQLAAKTESAFARTEAVSDFIVSDSRFQSLPEVDSYDAENPTAASRYDMLCEDLISYASVDSLIADVYVMFAPKELILSPGGRASYDDLPAILETFQITRLQFNALAGQQAAGWGLGTEQGGQLFYRQPLYSAKGEWIGQVFVLLNMERFREMIDMPGTALCSVRTADWFYSTRDIGSLTGEVRFTATKLSGVKNYTIEDDHATYLAALPRGNYYAPLYVIGALFLVYFALVLVWNRARQNMLSKQQYRAVQAAMRRVKNAEAGTKANAAYVALVQHQAVTLKGDRDERETDLRRMLLGIVPVEEAEARDRIFRAEVRYFNAACYFAGSSAKEGMAGGMFDPPENDKMLAKIILPALVQSQLGDLAEVRACTVGTNIVLLIGMRCSSDPAADQRVREAVGECAGWFEEHYELHYAYVVGKRFHHLKNSNKIYEQLCDSYDFERWIQSNEIYGQAYGEEPRRERNESYVRQIQMLTNYILAEKYELIPELVHEMLLSSRMNYQMEAQVSISGVAQLLAMLALSKGSPEFDGMENGLRLHECKNGEELLAATKEVMAKLSALQKTEESHDIVSDACRYMEAHYADPNMCLTMICEAQGVSAQHLSRLFRQQLNRTVAEYLNGCRIEAAKKLLADRRKTIAKIAQEVGYSSVDSLERNFRKREGVRPSEYRRLLGE